MIICCIQVHLPLNPTYVCNRSKQLDYVLLYRVLEIFVRKELEKKNLRIVYIFGMWPTEGGGHFHS